MEKQGYASILMSKAAKIEQQMARNLQYQGVATCFLGRTGSGKSTLTAYMIENKLIVKEYGDEYIITQAGNSNGPQIGSANSSCTKLSAIYPHKGESWYDSPGFEDTEGSQQEILNAYCNLKMFKASARVRIVIVIDYSSLKAIRGGALVDVAYRICKIFGTDATKIMNSCAIVISHVDLCESVTQSFVFEKIENIIKQNNSSKDPVVKVFLNSISSDRRVFIFPTPSIIDKRPQIIAQLRRNILQIRPVSLVNDSLISLSSKAEMQVQDIAKMVDKQIEVHSNRLKNWILANYSGDSSSKDVISRKMKILKEVSMVLTSYWKQSYEIQLLRQLNTKLQLPKDLNNILANLFGQIEFCQTLYNGIVLIDTFKNVISIAVTASLNSLKMQLAKITSAEERAQMQQDHERYLENQRIEYKQTISQLKQKQIDQQKAFEAKSQQDNKLFQQKFDNMAKQHKQETVRLNRRLKQMQDSMNRGGGRRGCQFM